MSTPIVADERSQSPLELAAIAAAFAAAAGDAVRSADPSSVFLASLGAAGSADLFPSTVEQTVRRCGRPANDLQRYAEDSLCAPGGQYREIIAAAYGWWSPVKDPRAPGSDAYRGRLNAFTIAKLRSLLQGAGYDDLGIVAPQSSDHGFPTPLVHSAFRRGTAGPIVIAGHRPETSADPAPAPPAVMELRFYFSM